MHFDCNEFYGGYYSSFNLQQLETLGGIYITLVVYQFLGNSKGVERKETKEWFELSPSSVVLENFESSSKNEIEQAIETTAAKDEIEGEKKLCKYEELKKESRQYSLDLLPKIFFSRGLDISLLISSGVSKYVEFKALENSFMYHDKQFQLVFLYDILKY